MRLIVLLISAAFALSANKATAEIAVVSGGRVKLATAGAFDQVCHSLGRVSVGIIEQPRAGTILVESVSDYPNFPAFNTRSRCNTLKLPFTRISYQATQGYTGTDETILELIGPEGRVRRIRYFLSVRPGVVLPPAAPEAELEALHPRRKIAKIHHAAAAKSAPPARPVRSPPQKKKPKEDEHPISI